MKFNKYIVIVFLLSAGIVSFATYNSIQNSRRSAELADKALTSEHQIARLEHACAVISNADDGVKNYIITGNERTLISYDTSFAKITRTMRSIKTDMQYDSVLIPELKIFEYRINTKMRFIDALVKVRKQSFDSAQKMVSSPLGISLMDSIKLQVSRMNKMEHNARVQYIAQEKVSNYKTTNIIILGSLLALLIICVVLFILNKDIFKRLVSEKQVRESEIRYRTIGQNIGSYIYTCDYYGKITFATPNIKDIIGYTSEEIIGKHFTFMIPADWIEHVKNANYTQFKNKVKEQTTKFEIITKEGKQKWVEQHVVVFSTDEMQMGFQCTLKESTPGQTSNL